MTHHTLASLGWSDFFARQVTPGAKPARIREVQRDRLFALSLEGDLMLTTQGSTGDFAVGDWVVHDGARVTQRLEPKSLIQRRAAGTAEVRQLIVSNIDTLAIVTSCNADFNPARLERYLAIALTAGALPLVILTKADLAADPEDYLRQARRISPLVTALAINAMNPAEAERLAPWAGPGQTLALVGSSGVGKTTIRNLLTDDPALTAAIREDDAKGRHTTTARSLVATRAGGCLIDTPGMRELRLTDAAEGVAQVFADIPELAAQCRFGDCQHEGEPGCAVQAAIDAGSLDPARLARWRKLEREDRFQTETLHERHDRIRKWAKATAHGSARSREKRRIGGED